MRRNKPGHTLLPTGGIRGHHARQPMLLSSTLQGDTASLHRERLPAHRTTTRNGGPTMTEEPSEETTQLVELIRRIAREIAYEIMDEHESDYAHRERKPGESYC